MKGIPQLNSPDVFISSDRDKGLLAAQQKVLPNSHSSYCALHLERNVNVNFKTSIKTNIFNAARATTIAEFDEAMETIKKGHVNGRKVFDYLMGCKENWANAYFPIPQYSVLTSNSSQVLT